MKTPLHILHLEDDPRDAALVQSTLQADGITCATTCVQSRDDFVAALEHGGIDLVLSDFSLPAFDGLSAVEIVRTRWPELPIILVSGSLGEERAVDSLKSGATDYVLKERLARLVPAVRRAMKEVKEHAENRRTEEKLRKTEQRLGIVFSESPLGIALVDLNGHPFHTNAALQKILGYSGEELSRMHFIDYTHPDDCAKDLELYQQLIRGARQSYQIEKRFIRKDGNVVSARLSVSAARGRRQDHPALQSPWLRILRSGASWRRSLSKRKKWRWSASLPAAWPTTLTTFSPSSLAMAICSQPGLTRKIR